MNILLLLLVSGPQVHESYLDRAVLEAQGFVDVRQWIDAPDGRRTALFSCHAKSANKDKEIRIGFSQTREEVPRGLRRGTSSQPHLIDDKEESPSGLPLGRNCRTSKSSDPVARPYGPSLGIEGPYETLSSAILPSNQTDDRGNLVHTTDLAYMAPFLESWARQVFSHGVGKRLRVSSPRQVAGREVRAMACSFSGTLFYDLEDWASARGWSLSRREDGSAADLERAGQRLVVPLAGGQAVWRGQHVELGDCVAEVGGRWYTPARLDELTEG